MINKNKDLQLAIIGLGYVGLPLALEFAKKRKVIGYDINKNRISQLRSGKDKNLEFSKLELKVSKKLNFTDNKNDLKYSIKFNPTNPELPVINILLILKYYIELSRLAYFDTTTFLE